MCRIQTKRQPNRKLTQTASILAGLVLLSSGSLVAAVSDDSLSLMTELYGLTKSVVKFNPYRR